MQYSAHIVRTTVDDVGVGLMICSTTNAIKPDDTLVIETPENNRLSGKVISSSNAELVLSFGESSGVFEPWKPGDDPLPTYDGDHSNWTRIK